MTYLKSYNYNLLTGKQIKIKDIFKSGTDYEKIINDYISKEIEKRIRIYILQVKMDLKASVVIKIFI